MKTPLIPATAVALLALTACQSKTETKTVDNSVTSNTTVAAAPVELPPAIKSEGSFRCHGDNSLVKVTFFDAGNDGSVSASVMSPPDAPPVMLKGPAAGQPMVADGGWSLTGNDKSFKLAQPGKPEQSCSK